MSMSDPIADLLTRLRNASNAKHEKVSVNFSKMKHSIIKILKEEGYIKSFAVEDNDGKKDISIELKYYNKKPVIQEIKRISRPGKRIYVSHQDIKPIYNNLGVAILTTSQGVITSAEAKQKGIGGEWICQIW